MLQPPVIADTLFTATDLDNLRAMTGETSAEVDDWVKAADQSDRAKKDRKMLMLALQAWMDCELRHMPKEATEVATTLKTDPYTGDSPHV